MSTRGRRDSFSDSWSWEPPADGGGHATRFPWRPLLGIVLAVGLTGVLAGLVLLSSDDGDNGTAIEDTATTSSSPGATPTRKETGPAPTPTATPGPTAEGPKVRLFAWSRTESRWIETELPGGAGYREGDAVPVLLRLEGATSGTVYETTVRYQCATEKGAAFDFLSSPAGVDAAAALADPAPGRPYPDSAVPVPNDPAIVFDDRGGGRFELWGGTFQQSIHGPTPDGACERQKELRLVVAAAKGTVFVIWAAHLASAQDWGPGRGAASQDGPLSIEVAVLGAGDTRLRIAVEAVQR